MRHNYVFTCPGCSRSFIVDECVRDDLLSDGCLFCQSSIEPDDFDTPSLVDRSGQSRQEPSLLVD